MPNNNLDAVQEWILGYDTYKPQGTYGVTSLEKARYRAWVEKNNPGVDCTLPIGYIDSKIGTGFHMIAEQAMNEFPDDCKTEEVLKGNIAGYEVGGTCDLILYEYNGMDQRVCDFKTMKAFPAKKAYANEETDKFIKQLSVYAYLIRQAGGTTIMTGYIYVFVVGWTARDKAIPRTFRLDLPLMNDKEVEDYVKGRIEALPADGTAPKFDCPSWMCEQYCGVRDVCPHYNHSEFKDEKVA